MMRDILFKELTSPDRKKRLFSICEAIEKDGILIKLEKKSTYIIKDKDQFTRFKNLPRISIVKVYNTQRKEERIAGKIVGNFYVAAGESIFYIIFIHSFKIEAVPLSIQSQ